MSKKCIRLIFIGLLVSSALHAEHKPKEPPVDHMALATMMVYDGNYEKAQNELKQVDTEVKDFDVAKYFSMQGIVSMKSDRQDEALGYFDKAIEATKVKVYVAPKEAEKKFTVYGYLFGEKEDNATKAPSFDGEKLRAEQISKLHLYKAEIYYKQKAYEKTITSLQLAGDAAKSKPQMFILLADCHWKLKNHAKAFEALEGGFAKFPKEVSLLKQKFYYYVDLGLFQKAIEVSKRYFENTTPIAKEYSLFAQALAKSGQIEEAIKVIENARVQFPKDGELGVLLGHLYLKRQMPHQSADLFEKSAYYDAKYIPDAAEMYRRVKSFPHALYLNTQILDNTEKIKQQVAIYVEREEFEKVIGLKDAMYRYNLLKDESLRYALAYAYFMLKEYKLSESHLKKLTSSDYFDKATVIRNNIEKCQNNSMECL